MRINGEWFLFGDGIERPVVHGEVLANDGSWVQAPFLVDTGADRTVLSAAILTALGLQSIVARDRLGGLGGIVDSVIFETQVRLTREEAGKVVFRGHYAAVTELESLDISVLGRDITGFFAVIVDRPDNVVCLVGQQHQYAIAQR
jgi:predicted aspartyl protease